MSKVYAVSVITADQYENGHDGVYKVFSSIEKAEQFIKENPDVFDLYEGRSSWYKAMVYISATIKEFEVN
jgi:hypothetical protein